VSKRVSVADRLDSAGITEAAERTGSVVERLLAPADVRVEQIPVDLLFDHPDNPRGAVGDVDELADSIKANGIYEPLIVVPAEKWQAVDARLPGCEPGDFVIVAGHRRKAAAVQAGQTSVPCLVRDDLVGADAEVAMLVENLQREDLSPIQEARGFAQLEASGKSQREIARLVGCQQPHVSKRLSLLRLPDDLQTKVGTDELAISDAVELAKLDDETLITDVLRNRKGWQSIADAAEDALEQRQQAAAVKEATDRVKAGGESVIKWPTGGVGPYSTPRSLRHLADEGVDISEHEHFACHAVVVGYDSGSALQTVRVCTNPKAHPESRDQKRQTEEDKRKAAAEKERAAKERRSIKRRDFTAGLLRTSPADFDDIVARRLLDEIVHQSFDEAEFDVLAGFLALHRAPMWDVDKESRDDGWDAMLAAIDKAADDDPQRVLRAAVMAQVEISAEYGWGGDDDRAAYLKLLQARGHKLSGPERQVVQSAAKKPKAAGVEPTVSEAPAACPDCGHDDVEVGCSCDTCFCGTETERVRLADDQEHEQLLEASEAVG
jgi:ParB/RepB/Spo0J family partition protein